MGAQTEMHEKQSAAHTKILMMYSIWMQIKEKFLPSIHPNKLQVFLGSLVPLLVSNTIFLHNRFETW